MSIPGSTKHHLSRWSALGAGLGFGLAMILAAPPLSWWGFSLVAIFPLAWVGSRAGVRPWRAGALAGLGSVPMWAMQQWWVREVSVAGFLPFVLALAALTGLFVACLGVVRVRTPRVPAWIAVPLLWTGLEFFRGEIIAGGYAWSFPAHPLIDAPGVWSVASAGGVYLVSLALAGVTGGAVDLLSGPARRTAGGAAVVAMLAAVVAAGVLAARGGPAPPRAIRVAAVQTNVSQSNKVAWTIEQEVSDFARFVALTRDAGARGPDLIVWPETMMPGLTLEPSAIGELRRQGVYFRVGGSGGREIDAAFFADSIAELSRELSIPMLIGEEGWDGLRVESGSDGVRFERSARFNSVYLLLAGRTQDVRYDKVCLTPFGEFMPLVHRWPGLQQSLLDLAATGMAFDLTAGTAPTVFEIPQGGSSVRVVTPICFEVTVARHLRALVFAKGARRADLIVNLTNDGWFGASRLGRLQHLQLARWRCAELATPMVRAANTGISAFIDARGRVLDSVAIDVDGVLSGPVALGSGSTAYARTGDLAGWTAAAGAMTLLGAGLLGWLKTLRTSAPAGK